MTLKVSLLSFCLLLAVFAANGAVKKKGTDVTELTVDEIVSFGKKAAAATVKTRMPQIDILHAILQAYRGDAELLGGKKELRISGSNFARAFPKVEKMFDAGVKEDDSFLKSSMEAPEILYSNFRAISLSGKGGKLRIKVELTESYEQELPYTFGAKIQMEKVFTGTVKTSSNGARTDIIFDDVNHVFFKAPGIAFFIPDVFTKAASISIEDGAIIGYVIGNPKSAKDRNVSVCYNLTTCSKKSIKSREIAPDTYEEITSIR
ncbi:MAG: hypothetical protein JNL74_10165 [Fibrobacteres bacterium]|nr:hypothetical protein [Fibrobacterota bacterium]